MLLVFTEVHVTEFAHQVLPAIAKASDPVTPESPRWDPDSKCVEGVPTDQGHAPMREIPGSFPTHAFWVQWASVVSADLRLASLDLQGFTELKLCPAVKLLQQTSFGSCLILRTIPLAR